MSEEKRKIVLAIVVLAIVGAIAFFESKKVRVSSLGGDDAIIRITTDTMSKEEKAKQYDTAKEIVNSAGFINTEGVSIRDLIGKKVILVDFWTYSCINCQRTLPYITAWYEKYKDQGLEVIGVHTPEFGFEHEYDNVLRATKQFGVTYPVVLDNDYATWNAYKNRYWPRKYLIDIDGFIVYDHIGEGAYEVTEKKIQELLEERKVALGEDIEISTGITVPEDAEEVDTARPRTSETYLGAARNVGLGNGKQGVRGVQIFTEPEGIKTGILYLDGEWNMEPEFAESVSKGAKIILRYQAEKVFLVVRSEEGVRAKILIDGEPVGKRAGKHVDADSTVFFKEDQLYRLVEDPDGWGEHTLEIIIEGPGVQVFAFTFG